MEIFRFRPLGNNRRILALTLAGALLATAVALIASMELNIHTAIGAGGGGFCFPSSGPACTVKGHQAFADFSSQSPDGCTVTDLSVAAFDNVVRPTQTQSSQFVLVMLTEETFCPTFNFTFAQNIDPITEAPDFAGTYQFNSGELLSTASVIGSAQMYGFDSMGNPIQFTSSINLAWSGFGPTTSFLDSFHLRSPGMMLMERSQGSSRQAEVSGSVTGPNAQNLAIIPTLNADLSNVSGGTIALSHP